MSPGSYQTGVAETDSADKGALQVFLEACAEHLERFDAALLRAHSF